MSPETSVVARHAGRHQPRRGRSRSSPIGILERVLVVLLTMVVLAGSLVGLTPDVGADPQGIQSEILLNGTKYDGTYVVDEGATLTLKVQYDSSVTPGSTVEFELGPNVTVTGVPAANTAIESVTQAGNKVFITFKDPWPTGVNQGIFELSFVVDHVDESTREPITWKVDGSESSVTVIIRDTGDQFANVSDATAKSISGTNIDGYVTVDPHSGVVTLDPSITNRDITYTLTVDSAANRDAFTIADQLPGYLTYVDGSFDAQVTTWDDAGLNRRTDPFAFSPLVTTTGNGADSFTSTVDLPGPGARDPQGPSVLRISYKARVVASKLSDLQTALQGAHDAANGTPGVFSVAMVNTATFGSVTRQATARVRGTIAGVDVGQAFAKTADWSTRTVVTDQTGVLTPPAQITYTLKADLRGWDGSSTNFILSRNVVITDTLPGQASWNTTDPQFLTSTGIALTSIGCPEDPSDFAGDSYIGRYCVDGQRLMVNVGKDNTTNASIQVKAQLDTINGLTKAGSTTIAEATPYRWRNTASFQHKDDASYQATRDVTVIDLPDTSGGINDSSVFTKTGDAGDAMVDPGDTLTVDYTFELAAGKGIDVRTSRIVDYVDHDIFDLEDLSGVVISGTYAGQPLTGAHFDLSVDTDGNLVIELNAAGSLIVDAQGVDKAYVVTVTLETRPFIGKETRTITNRATLFGSDDDPMYWSEATGEATSFGDEAEIRKRVFDNLTGQWSASADALMDGEGNLAQQVWVYRVEFIPHGSYDNVTIIPVLDDLPGAVEFLGFVDEDDTSGDTPSAGPVEIGGNLIASYDSGSHLMTITQKSGTKLNASGSPFTAYFAVRVNDASEAIVNTINDTSATIVPRPSVSVGDHVWVDTDRDGRQDSGEPGIPGVVLTIVGPDGGPVVDVYGDQVGPVTTDADGLYSFDDLPALSDDQTYTVCIDQKASAEVLKAYVPTEEGVGDREGDSATWCASTRPGDLHDDGDRDPTLDFGFVLKTYAVGDYVWVDTNRNGVQDEGEAPLSDVGVELFDAAGRSLGSTTTDENGRYVFDDLPAGTYRVRFTLTDAQAAIYTFTSTNDGPGSLDSDADRATGWTRTFVLDDSNTSLTLDYEYRDIDATQGIDPTWDAGVVPRADDMGVGAGGANRGGKLAWTGSDVTSLAILSLIAISLGLVSMNLARYRRRES